MNYVKFCPKCCYIHFEYNPDEPMYFGAGQYEQEYIRSKKEYEMYLRDECKCCHSKLITTDIILEDYLREIGYDIFQYWWNRALSDRNKFIEINRKILAEKIKPMNQIDMNLSANNLYGYYGISANSAPQPSTPTPPIQSNTPKCPTCGSAQVQQISSFERTTSVLTLGIFSKKINKSYKCRNCGYTW